MKSLLLLVAVFFSIHCFSQDSSFQIKDYKYRTPGFQALGLNLNFSGSYYDRKVNDVNTERRNNTTLGPLAANYYHIRSNDKRLQQSTITLSSGYSSYSIKEQLRKENYNDFDNQALWQITTKDYRKNDWFFEWGNEFRGRINTGKTETQTFHAKGNEVGANNTVTVGFGKGRVEWVQDAQMALYILQELASQNLLNRKPSADESNAFAQLITDIRNRRVFDGRRRRIYELTRIDSFLKKNDLVTQTDIRHFTIVNDNWAFAINPFRQSGKTWFVRLRPGININNSRFTNKLSQQPDYNESLLRFIYFSPEVVFENYKPVNLKWQRNFKIVTYYLGQQYFQKSKQVSNGNSTENKIDGYGGSWNFDANYGLGFFPNTRTQITCEFGLLTSYINSNAWGVQSSFNLSVDYFIGYRTFLSGHLSASHSHNRYESLLTNAKTESFSSDFAIRLSHFLF